MGKQQIEAYIPKAIEAIEAIEIAKKSDNDEWVVPKQFNGYISSFGASIRMAGIVPTVLFFKNSENSEEARDKVVTAIEKIIGKKLLINNQKNPEIDRKMIEDAASALKLAVRTYKLSKD